MSSKKWRALPVLSAAALVLVMAACGSSGGGSSSSGSTKTKTIGVILPDTTTSPRWEANDRPSLNAAFTAAGFKGDIQNAGGDKTKFSTICQSMINEGVSVLMIVNLDSDSGGACLKKAAAAGIKSIDYDRLTLGGGASYYVSFDNVEVGKLQGEGLQKCLDAAGKTKANIVYINGDPTDNNAALFKSGLRRGAPAEDRLRATTSSSATRAASGTPPRLATLSSSCTRRTRARSTASSRPTTRWPAASSPASRRTALPARCR